MAINPSVITTIRVDQLPDDTLTLDSLFPHTVGTDLKSSTIQELVDLVATTLGVSTGVGFLPISVTNGQQLPNVPTDPSFFLCGAGTYLNVNGYPDVICTEAFNAVMSLSDHWELAVEIPIVAVTGVQSVTGSAVDNTDPLNPIINASSLSTPDLQDVTDVGKVTTNEIKAKWFEFYDAANDAYGKVFFEDGIYTFYDSVGSIMFSFDNVGNDIRYNADGFNLYKNNGLLTADRIRQEPDKDGTYAMLDDIPTVPTTATDVDALKRDGSNANSDVNIDGFGFIATFFKGLAKVFSVDSAKFVNLNTTNVTTERNQELQDKDGTFAYMDDIPSVSGLVPDTRTVNGKALSSNITLNTDDIAESGTPTNKWFTNARAIASTLTSFVSGAGTVSATDTILQAIQKIVGNLDTKADKSLGAYKMRANNTNATANGTEQVFKAIDQQSYGGTITFTAGTAPSGALSSAYSWMQIGNMVTLTLSATYANAGATVTQCAIPLPTDMPSPIKPTGRTSASEKLYTANGQMMATTTGTTAAAFSSYLRANSANTGFEFVITMSSGSYKVIDLTCTYPVS